jgi:hypothetical protein
MGDQVQSIPIEDSTYYDVCSEECAIKALKKVGKPLFHPEIKKENHVQKTDK